RLDQVYAHCEDYPVAGTAKDVKAYLERHAQNGPWAACFDGILGRTLEQIRAEDELRRELKGFLDERDWTGFSQSHVYLMAKASLKKSRPASQWIRQSPATPTVKGRLRTYGIIFAVVILVSLVIFKIEALLVIAALLGLAVLILGPWIYLLHRDEVRAERSFVPPAR